MQFLYKFEKIQFSVHFDIFCHGRWTFEICRRSDQAIYHHPRWPGATNSGLGRALFQWRSQWKKYLHDKWEIFHCHVTGRYVDGRGCACRWSSMNSDLHYQPFQISVFTHVVCVSCELICDLATLQTCFILKPNQIYVNVAIKTMLSKWCFWM